MEQENVSIPGTTPMNGEDNANQPSLLVTLSNRLSASSIVIVSNVNDDSNSKTENKKEAEEPHSIFSEATKEDGSPFTIVHDIKQFDQKPAISQPLPPSPSPKKEKQHIPVANFQSKFNDFHQIRALFLKTMMLQLRQYKTNILQLIFPIVLLFVVFILQLIVDANTQNKGSILTYKDPQSGYSAASLIPLIYFYEMTSSPPALYMPDQFLLTMSSNSPSATNAQLANLVGMRYDNGTGYGLLSRFPQTPVNFSSHEPHLYLAPYFVSKDTPKQVDEYLYDQLAKPNNSTTKQLDSFGSYNFMDLSTSWDNPKMSYDIQFDSAAKTDFCNL